MFLLIIFQIFTAPSASKEVRLIKGYIKISSPLLSEAIGSASGISYLSDNRSAFFYADEYAFTTDNITLPLADNQTLEVKGYNPGVWNFQQGYTVKSGTAAIHELQVRLPDCMLGNVCIPNKPFSISFPQLSTKSLNSLKFFIGKEDISTLFYFNEQQQSFRIKEFYESQFFSHFKGEGAELSWRNGSGKNALTGRVRIILADKAIRGRIVAETGKNPAYLAGRELTFTFRGSDTILPHTFSTAIDRKGEYLLENLPSFEYKPTISPLTASKLKFISVETVDGITSLNIEHTVPDYDELFNAEYNVNRGGEFIILAPSALTPRFSGDITEFIQKSGDQVRFKVTKNRVALLFPEKRSSAEVISFSARVGGKKILFIFPRPFKIDNIYEQFSPFSGDGYYAQTSLTGFENGGVLEFNSKNIPSSSLNSFTKSSATNVKVHLFDLLGKAADITSYFDWNNAAQTLTLNPKRFKDLYERLKNNQATLGVTFCGAVYKNRCFRIKKEIRPGAAEVLVTPSITPTEDMFAVLRQLDNPELPLVRTAQADNGGRYRFIDIPEGKYQILLADLTLKNQGFLYTSVTFEDNEERTEINIDLPVSPISQKPDWRMVTEGNWINLLEEPLRLHKNDFKSMDLKSFNISAVDDISVAGYFPGEYTLHSDLTLMLYTRESSKDFHSVFILKNRDMLYTLPIFYNGNDLPVISEEGLDYAMCPKDRPHCTNAFVDIKGVSGGIYNGRIPLSLSFPITFNRQDLSVVMEQVSDITDLFLVNSKYNRITLKRSAIPAFLSYLSTNSSPVRITVKNRRYYLNLIAGYKSAEISVTDTFGAQNALFSGLEMNVACEYGLGRIYSSNVAVSTSGFVRLDDLPDCAYHISLIDRKRFFAGELDMSLQAGQNKKKEILQVSCVSANDQFVDNCIPIIPVVSKNRLIAPEVALLFADTEGTADVDGENWNLKSKIFRHAIVFHAPKSKDGKAFQSRFILNDNASVINIAVESIAAHRIKTVSRPTGSPLPVLRLAGVNDAFTYQGGEFAVTFDNMEKFDGDDISVSCRSANITDMFSYDPQTRTLTLISDNQGKFAALFNDGWLQLIISIGAGNNIPGYNIALILALSSSDIFATAVGVAAAGFKSANAILAGSRNVNGFEFRQEIWLGSNKTAIFRQVPFGIYNLTIFDLDADVFGSAEVSVPPGKTDLYLDLEVNKIVE
ncbi:MAG: hypothetical protein LBD73_03785 [Deferribacteraceae bacterium]|nr:hypothetical protein [Deferribacteraceae bacterium]